MVCMVADSVLTSFITHRYNWVQAFITTHIKCDHCTALHSPLQALTDRSSPQSGHQYFMQVNVWLLYMTGMSLIWGHSPVVTWIHISGRIRTVAKIITVIIHIHSRVVRLYMYYEWNFYPFYLYPSAVIFGHSDLHERSKKANIKCKLSRFILYIVYRLV